MEDYDATGKLVTRCDDCHDEAITECAVCGKDLCENCMEEILDDAHTRPKAQREWTCETCQDKEV